MESEKDLTIIVPVYNEEENLPRVEKELSAFMRTSEIKACILFVNDGSTDNSPNLIESICFKNNAFKYIHLKKNSGLSTALKAGIDHITTKYTGYIDADLQTSPEDFKLLIPFIDSYDFVTGIRTQRKDSFVKKISSIIANAIRRSVTHDGISDTGCPLKIIRTEVAKQIPFFDGMHRFLAALVLVAGGSVKEVPVSHSHRLAGKPKYHLWNRLIGPLVDLCAFCWIRRNYIRYEIIRKG